MPFLIAIGTIKILLQVVDVLKLILLHPISLLVRIVINAVIIFMTAFLDKNQLTLLSLVLTLNRIVHTFQVFLVAWVLRTIRHNPTNQAPHNSGSSDALIRKRKVRGMQSIQTNNSDQLFRVHGTFADITNLLCTLDILYSYFDYYFYYYLIFIFILLLVLYNNLSTVKVL
jgi:hypothetical protein